MVWGKGVFSIGEGKGVFSIGEGKGVFSIGEVKGVFSILGKKKPGISARLDYFLF